MDEPVSHPARSTLPPVTIVGAGNWLISCDRIGPRVLELCRDRFASEVELFNSGSAGLSLLDGLRGQELMLIVDACSQGWPSGEVRVREMDFSSPSARGSSLHQIGPLETLSVARQLYPEKIPRRVVLILVETEGLTETDIDQACTRVLAAVDKEIKLWRSHASD